ncbi:hypothetical protein AX16_010918, partial [Volvariella volvacea WC 439]
MDLEQAHQLDVDNLAYLWLFYYLFLPILHDEGKQWIAAWNVHRIWLPGPSVGQTINMDWTYGYPDQVYGL